MRGSLDLLGRSLQPTAASSHQYLFELSARAKRSRAISHLRLKLCQQLLISTAMLVKQEKCEAGWRRLATLAASRATEKF